MRRGLLVALCNGPSGLVRTSINPQTCRGGDIVNRNGQLACNGGYSNGNGYGRGHAYGRHRHDNDNRDNNDRDNNGNYNNGNYNNGYGNNGNNGYGNNGYGNGNGNHGYGNGRGYGNGTVSGSYQQSCTNVSMSNGILTATCPGPNGSITTSINARGCQGDIANVNGRLRCQ